MVLINLKGRFLGLLVIIAFVGGGFLSGCGKIVKDGVKKGYYKSGRLKHESEFKNWKPHGRYREYYENGVLKVEGEFKYGKPDGVVRAFNDQGRVVMKELYADGEFISGANYEDAKVDTSSFRKQSK